MKKKKSRDELDAERRDAIGEMSRIGLQLRASNDERDRLQGEIARLRKLTEGPIPRIYVRVIDARGNYQHQYEGNSPESFGQWCLEILFPALIRDLRDLGDAAQLRITGNIIE